MKKWMALICMIACIFGLTACGSEEMLTEYEQVKIENAQYLSEQIIVPLLSQYMDDVRVNSLDIYTAEEIEHMLDQQLEIYVDGNAFTAAIDSFYSALPSMGAITDITGSTAVIDRDQIIVEIEVTGEKKSGTVELILSNDMFLRLESAALNPKSGMGELMGKAALNTLIGMGTVFAVLILISLIISCFGVIPKIQENMAKKKAAKKGGAGVNGVENAVAQIVEQETAVDETEDLELVAVIAAAVAAWEGSASTDGFVVRSIRRRA